MAVTTSTVRALVADDDRTTTAVLRQTLRQWGVDVFVADDGLAAWQLLQDGCSPSIAILDWMMPGLDGIELCRRIRTTPSLAGLYVILLTGRSTRNDLVHGLDAGADDYMIKPIETEELRARVQVGLRAVTHQGRLTERVAELQATRDHLARLASTDALTELYTRRWWFELAATEFSRCRRYDRSFSLLVIDLDHFKHVNDTYGHESGDRLLQRFADTLRLVCRHSDIAGRLGGEEFALLVPETPLVAAQPIADRIVHACRALSVETPDGAVGCTCSIGLSSGPRTTASRRS